MAYRFLMQQLAQLSDDQILFENSIHNDAKYTHKIRAFICYSLLYIFDYNFIFVDFCIDIEK